VKRFARKMKQIVEREATTHSSDGFKVGTMIDLQNEE
jgi:hypothetical protein